MKGGSVMINEYINELVAYGLNQGLVDPEDEVYVTNRLLELFQLTEHEGTAKEVRSERELSQILNDMLEYACRQGMLEEETITEKDLFDTKIMGILTPHPSVVRRKCSVCIPDIICDGIFGINIIYLLKLQQIFIISLARQQIILEKIELQRMRNGQQIQNLVQWI